MRRSPSEPTVAAVEPSAVQHTVVRCGLGASGWARCALAPVVALWPVAAAWAQTDTLPKALSIQPTASISQSFSDNVLLTPTNPQGGSMTRLSAGVALRARSGLVRGFLDYSLSQVLYSAGQQNSLQNALNANVDTELVDGRAKLGVTAAISQSAVSAFGAQPSLGGGSQANTTEVRNLRVTPSFQGPIGSALRYTSQVSYALTDARDTQVGDGSTASAAVHIQPTLLTRLSWGLDGSHQRTAYKLGRTTTNDRLSGTATTQLHDLDLQLQAGAGVELTDLSTVQRTSYHTWGLGATWTPSTRTRVAAQYDHRFYGASHSLTLEHRTALTTWRLTDSRSLSTAGDQPAAAGRGTAYDLFYSQFASLIPDPVKRQDFTNDFLSKQGIIPGQQIGFLRSSASVLEAQEASVAWRNVRSTAVIAFTRTATRRLDTSAGMVGDLANSATVRQRGLSVNLTHRLTPQSTLNLLATEQRGQGDQANQRSRQRQFSLQATTTPTVGSTLTGGIRRALYDTFPTAYGESAIFATYGIRF